MSQPHDSASNFSRRQWLQTAGASALLAGLGQQAMAQASAFETVKIITGFAAGGTSDTICRRVADKLPGTGYTKAAFVENKTGAGGQIAIQFVKSQNPDGQTLLQTPMSMLGIYPHIYKKLAYDPVNDLTPVSLGCVFDFGFAVGPSVPASVKTVPDFLAWCKANPKDASYGSPGAGSTPHFIGALLGLNAGVEMRHVPYRGSIPGVTDLVGGQIAAMVTPSGDFIANAKAGKLRILATSGEKRSPYLPEVATFAEQGFADLTTEEWFGFYAPAKTPAPVVAAANAAINAALKEKSVIDSLAIVGLIAQGSTPEEMGRSQKLEFERWGPLVKRIGFSAES